MDEKKLWIVIRQWKILAIIKFKTKVIKNRDKSSWLKLFIRIDMQGWRKLKNQFHNSFKLN